MRYGVGQMGDAAAGTVLEGSTAPPRHLASAAAFALAGKSATRWRPGTARESASMCEWASMSDPSGLLHSSTRALVTEMQILQVQITTERLLLNELFCCPQILVGIPGTRYLAGRDDTAIQTRADDDDRFGVYNSYDQGHSG